MSEEENEHARNFMKYQNMRGGRVVFQDIPKPPADDWQSALNAVQMALGLEKKVNAVSHIYHDFDQRIKNSLSIFKFLETQNGKRNSAL